MSNWFIYVITVHCTLIDSHTVEPQLIAKKINEKHTQNRINRKTGQP